MTVEKSALHRNLTDDSLAELSDVPLGLFWSKVALGLLALSTLLSALVILAELYWLFGYMFATATPIRHEYLTGLFLTAIYGGGFSGFATWFFSGAELAPVWLARVARTMVALTVAVPLTVWGLVALLAT